MAKKRGKEKALAAEPKAKIPIGLNFLIIYTVIIGSFYLLLGATTATTILFGYVLKGAGALIVNVLFMLVIAVIIFGLIKRKAFGWYLAVGWFGFEILNSFSSITAIRDPSFAAIQTFFRIALTFIIAIDGLIIWYLFVKKNCFIKGVKFHHFKSEDKVFVALMSILIAIIVISGIYVALKIYIDTANISKEVISDFHGKSIGESLFLCSLKKDIEKDVCYMSIAVVYDDTPSFVCDKINFNFYKFSCMQAIR